MNDINSKPVALVTGGSKGIGRAICVELAQYGYHVIINYLSDAQGAGDTLAQIEAQNGSGETAQFDVSNYEASQGALETLLGRHATMDVLINNAGRIADELFIMMTRDKWQNVIDLTLQGFYNITRPVLEKMVVQKRGAVVSIASVAGIMGNRGQSNYAAAKAGLIGASRSVAMEVARLGIRVNVVAPGLIQTGMIQEAPVQKIKGMIPMARLGQAQEVARVVRFLCSDDASYVTGQVLSVNGGMF